MLATIGVALDDTAGARSILEPLVEQLRAWGLPMFLSWALSILGAVLLAEGEHQAAQGALQEANEAGRALSQTTRDLVLDRLPEHAELTDLGVHRLRACLRPCAPWVDVLGSDATSAIWQMF